MSAPLAHIYTLADPRTSAVRYVGETADTRRRFAQHRAMRQDANERKNTWFGELLAAGREPAPHTLCIVPRHLRREWESVWIEHFFFAGCDLVNVLTPDVWDDYSIRRAQMDGGFPAARERAYLLGKCRELAGQYVRDWAQLHREPVEEGLRAIYG